MYEAWTVDLRLRRRRNIGNDHIDLGVFGQRHVVAEPDLAIFDNAFDREDCHGTPLALRRLVSLDRHKKTSSTCKTLCASTRKYIPPQANRVCLRRFIWSSVILLRHHRGRTASYPTAPAQIPACGFLAPGSSGILASAIRPRPERLPLWSEVAQRPVVVVIPAELGIEPRKQDPQPQMAVLPTPLGEPLQGVL